MIDRIKKMFVLGFNQLQDPYYQGIAAQVAFFLMLSIVPTLVLLSQLLSFFHLSIDSIGEYLDIEITPDIITSLQSLLKFESQTSTNIVLFIAAIWAASRLQFVLMRVANYTISEGRDLGTFWKDRGRSMVTMILTILTMVLIILILVYGQLVFQFLANRLLIKDVFDAAWRYLRWPIAGGLYLLLISFNYYVLPHSRSKIKDLMPGSIFCAIGMLLVTMLYSAYTSYAVSNNIIYGSMASIAALMFWFYFISWVIILGIFFNKVWSDTKVINDEKA